MSSGNSSGGGNVSDPAAAAAAYEALVTEMIMLQTTYFASVGALAWIIYDVVITFEQEWEFIWRAKWSFPKVLYLLTRYYGIFNLSFYLSSQLSANVSVEYCDFWIWFDSFSNSVFFTTTVNILFVIRINALFEGKKVVLALLVFLYLAEFIVEVIVTTITIHSIVLVPRTPGLPIRGCTSQKPPQFALVSWITCLIVACVFWMLTTYKMALSIGVGSWFKVNLFLKQVRAYPIMEIFYRDGSIFFGMIFTIILVNTVFNQIGGVYEAVGGPWLSATYAVAGSRLVLNLKSISSHPSGVRLEFSSFSASGHRAPRFHLRNVQSFGDPGTFVAARPEDLDECEMDTVMTDQEVEHQPDTRVEIV